MMKKSRGVLVFLIAAALGLGTADAQEISEETQSCLGCHGTEGLSLVFENGQEMSVHVDFTQLNKSVHGTLECTSCHDGFSVEDHPVGKFRNKREFQHATASLCTGCHVMTSGIHGKMLESAAAPCTDCHGSHMVSRVGDATGCMDCHSQSLALEFDDGTRKSLLVDADALNASVHSKLACSDCHFGITRGEHPIRRFPGQREHTVAASESCRRCHFDKYTKAMEGIHYAMLTGGNMSAPVCADCHGSHAISAGSREKLLSARKCEQCHGDIFRTYLDSAHGSALLNEHNQDVPICSDCHRAHDIRDPRTVDFRNRSPQMCGNCHANEDLMAKYGLSTAVLESYLGDFHGVTVTFYRKGGDAVRHIAVCTDCHGIHDITHTEGPNSNVVKENLVKRCQKCHPDATGNFPDAWISHYEPSFKRAPLVFAVTMTYRIFIPFMIAGLILQILLHVWRYAVNR